MTKALLIFLLLKNKFKQTDKITQSKNTYKCQFLMLASRYQVLINKYLLTYKINEKRKKNHTTYCLC